MPTLTAAGLQWALLHKDDSPAARLALLAWAGGALDWPEGHRAAAIYAANTSGRCKS